MSQCFPFAADTVFRCTILLGPWPQNPERRTYNLQPSPSLIAHRSLLIAYLSLLVASQADVKAVRPRRGAPQQRQARKQPWIRPKDAPPLQWPVPHGTVTSSFGPRRGSFHDGIDIAAPVGAAVRAAAKGDVAYSGSLPGYGNVIILRHGTGYATVYAHNDQNLVEEGQRVNQGQLIATVGRSGRTSGANLHFEVRKDNVAHDPLQFLPARQRAMKDKQ